MKIYPAIDLMNGQCVRLRMGDFEDSVVYSNDPKAVVQQLQDLGASNLHLVDLNGAKNPQNRQEKLIAELAKDNNLKIQVGGGIRSFQDAANLLNLGVNRVVLGSAAITQPELILLLLKEFGPERITLAMDVQVNPDGNPTIAISGWQHDSQEDLFYWMFHYLREGTRYFLCTDIKRDGMMKGPNLALYQSLIEKFPEIQLQASGGVSSIEDVTSLKDIGVYSTVIGKAFYEGTICLREAISQC